MRLILSAILVLALLPPKSYTTGDWIDIEQDGDYWDLVAYYLPDGARDVQGVLFEGYIDSYLIARYTYGLSIDTWDESVVEEPSSGLIAGILSGGGFELLLEIRDPEAWDYPFMYDAIDFGSFTVDGEDIDALFTLGIYYSGDSVLNAYALCDCDEGEREIEWVPEVEIADRHLAGIKIAPHLGGVIVWMQDPDAFWHEPFRVVQMLYVLENDEGYRLVEDRRAVTKEMYDSFPDEPPFDW
jgi:hypothetical protein